MTIKIGSGLQNFAFPAGYTGPSGGKQSGGVQADANLSRAIEELKEAAAKTPAERARDAVLKKHGIDEKGYNELDAAARKAIDEEIAEAVQRTVGAKEKAETSFIRMG
ncbi:MULTISPECIES: hypothetical protein [unclassified Sphingobium]|uniref:hypothetical protein n=1 Tax=unclassified Sphingobium TaxID=2611147 RepID=UPI0035A6F0D2